MVVRMAMQRACSPAMAPSADEHARLSVQAGQGHEYGDVLLTLLGAVEDESVAGSASTARVRSISSGRSSMATTASMTPFSASSPPAARPRGRVSFEASKTFGPRKPTRATGSATVTWPCEPHEA